MPQGKQRGRPPLADRSTNRPGDAQHSSKTAGQKLPTRYLNEFLEEMDHEVQERCEKMQDFERDVIQDMSEMLARLMFTLPTKIKSMPFKEFAAQHGNPAEPLRLMESRSISEASGMVAATPEQPSRSGRQRQNEIAPVGHASVARTTKKQARELAGLGVEGQAVPETVGRATRSKGSNSHVMTTPMGAHIRANSALAGTPANARLPRPNEAIFSQNGSPVGSFQNSVFTPLPNQSQPFPTPMYTAQGTVGRPLRVGGSEALLPTIGMAININLEDGRLVQITRPEDIEALEDNLKSLACEQLEAMKNWTANLTAQIGNG